MAGATSRRRFLRDAGAATATLASSGALAAPGVARRPRKRRRQTVAVFGGGIAGLTAAHELVERGFDVTVYERREWGGKARSTELPGSATGGRKLLPGEHAYRAEFGCYQNVPDTMRRIPFGSNPNGVFDNMVELPQALLTRTQKRDLVLPLTLAPNRRDYSPEKVIDLLVGLLIELQVPPDAAAHLGGRMAAFMSSCDERRTGQWERMTWDEFLDLDRFSEDYRRFLGRLWEWVQGTKAADIGAKYPAWFLEVWLIYGLLGRGTNGACMRMLNLPTSEAWITPWVEHVRGLGATLRRNQELTRLIFRDGRIAGARLKTPRGTRTVTADWYVSAMPVEYARRLWNRQILQADPKLRDMNRFRTAWYNGISLFLRERTNIVNCIAASMDGPWVVSFVPQAQLWPVDFASRYGDGTVKDKLSCVISEWDTPGVVFGKPARDCTPQELIRDLWEQLKRDVNDPGEPPKLRDDMLHSWQVDPALISRGGRYVENIDQLVVPAVGTEQYRPSPETRIKNLILTGDYLDGPWEVANMEAACFNGRRAANVVLDRSASRQPDARAIKPYRPPEWEPLKRIDEERWRRGQPNLFDADLTASEVRDLLARHGG